MLSRSQASRAVGAPHRHDPAGDDAFARLLEEIVLRLESGERVELAAYVREWPQFADRLRGLWPTLEVLVDLRCSPGDQGLTQPDPAAPPRELGDFRIVREIGRGGMGIVYEAEQLSLARTVALKVLPFAAMLDEKQLQRFRNEARAAAGLHHPHIVPVYSVGCERGVHYYAMQFINGRSLAALIAERRSLLPGESEASAAHAGSEPRAGADELRATGTLGNLATQPDRARTERSPGSGVEWCRQVARMGAEVADALEYAHSIAIVHRDIKPSNLILDERGRIWVTDFGLAQIDAEAGLTMTGDLVGTLRYMSPEQQSGHPARVDHRTDLYSLGSTLYELLTLEPLRPGTTRAELLSADQREPRPPRQINPAIPRDLETIVLRATAAEPADRYDSARALADDLRRFLDHRPVLARRPGVAERLARWSRRHPGRLWAVAVVLLVVAAGASLSTVLVGRARDVAERALGDLRQHQEALQTQTSLAARQKQRAEQLNARLLAERGIAAVNAGRPEGLLDLADACLAADAAETGPASFARLWAIAHQIWEGRLVHTEPSADVVAFSPDGQWIALAGGTRCRFRSLSSNRAVGEEMTLERTIGTLVFSPDGKLLVTHSVEGVARLWHVPDGTPVGPALPAGSAPPTGPALPAGQPLRHALVPVEFPANARLAASFSPDGEFLATAGADGTARLWPTSNPEAGGPVVRHDDEVWGVLFSPGGDRLLTATFDGSVRLWKLTSGGPTTVPRVVPDAAAAEPLAQIRGFNSGEAAFSSDGRWIATLRGVWRTGTLRRLDGVAHEDAETLDLSPDSRLLATAGRDWMVRLWDLDAGRESLPPLRHEARVRALDFSPDGRLLATGSMDESVRLWDVAARRARGPVLSLPGPVSRVQFSPDGRFVAGCSMWGPARVWRVDVPAGVAALSCSQPARAAAFSPDGLRLAVGCDDGHVRLLDLATGREVGAFPLDRQPVTAVAWGPDGLLMAAATRAGTSIRLFDVTSADDGLSWGLDTGPQQVTSLDFSPDGRYLAEGSLGWQVRIWSLSSREAVRTIRCREQVHGVRFSEDGQTVLTALRDGTIRGWDAATGRQVGPTLKHDGPAWSLCLTSGLLASVTGDPERTRVSVWSRDDDGLRDGMHVPCLEGVAAVCSRPDGRQMAGVTTDGGILVWDVPEPPHDIGRVQDITSRTLGVRRDGSGRLIAVTPPGAASGSPEGAASEETLP